MFGATKITDILFLIVANVNYEITIGLELKKLRGQSTSLKGSPNTAAAMSSHQDLIVALNETQRK